MTTSLKLILKVEAFYNLSEKWAVIVTQFKLLLTVTALLHLVSLIDLLWILTSIFCVDIGCV